MEYKDAKDIRKKSFSEMLAEKIMAGDGVGSSIKSSLSEKSKAKAVGIKEKFDPMNIAKAVGGEGGAAIYGKMASRSDADMEHFTGVKPAQSKQPKSELDEDTNTSEPVKILGDIYKLMKEDREDLVKDRELAKSKVVDNRREEDEWHKQLIDVLTYKPDKPSIDKLPKPKQDKPKQDKTGSSSKGSKGKSKGKSPSKGGKVAAAVGGGLLLAGGAVAATKAFGGSSKKSESSSGGSSAGSKADSEGKTAEKSSGGGGGGSKGGGQSPKSTAAFIAKEEGLPKGNKAMWDPPGQKNLVSVGYGHQIQADEYKAGAIKAGNESVKISGEKGIDTVITPPQAQDLLQQDLPKYVDRAKKPLGDSWEKLGEPQKAALTSYAYNTGSTASLVKAGLKQTIDNGTVKDGASVIRDKGVKTAGGVINKTLAARRGREADLYASKEMGGGGASESDNKPSANKSPKATGEAPSVYGSSASATKQAPGQTQVTETASEARANTPTKLSPLVGVQSGVDISKLQPALESRLATMAAAFKEKTGKKLLVTSGYRSNEKQKELFDAKLAQFGGDVARTRKLVAEPAAPLGNGKGSMHMVGLAVDINSKGADGINALAGPRDKPTGWLESFGLTRPVKGEDWHIQMVGSAPTADNPVSPGQPTLVANKDGATDLKDAKKEPMPTASPEKKKEASKAQQSSPSPVAVASASPPPPPQPAPVSPPPKTAPVADASSKNKTLKDNLPKDEPSVVVNNINVSKPSSGKQPNVPTEEVDDGPLYFRKVYYG